LVGTSRRGGRSGEGWKPMKKAGKQEMLQGVGGGGKAGESKFRPQIHS